MKKLKKALLVTGWCGLLFSNIYVSSTFGFEPLVYKCLKIEKEKIIIDGKIDESVWQKAGIEKITEVIKKSPDEADSVTCRTPKSHLGLGTFTGPSDISFRWRSLWDDENFYLGVEITDDKPVNSKVDKYWWEQDGIEIFFDPGCEGRLNYQYYILPFCEGGKKALSPDCKSVKAGSSRTTNGYVIEAAIPLAFFRQRYSLDIREGKILGFDIAIDDCDEKRETQIVWAGTGGNWLCSVHYGRIIFQDEKGKAKILEKWKLKQPSTILPIGPYVQNVTAKSAVICWKTETPLKCKLSYWSRDTKKDYVEKTPVIVHEVTLSHLKPDTGYEFELSCPNLQYTKKGSFHTAPETFKDFQFIAYGDTRSYSGAHVKVINAMLTDKEAAPRFILHTGDLTGGGKKYELWKGEFFNPLTTLIANVPVYPCLGNHEQNSPYYFDFFCLPGNERYYSFTYSYADFFMLDNYTPLTPESEQYKWLEAELKNSKSTWRFVSMHVPVYSSGPHAVVDTNGVPKEAEIMVAQKYLAPLFEKYKVDMVFSGHDHFYERSFRNGIYYIVTGAGGAPNYQKSEDKSQNPYSRKFESVNHYCLVGVEKEQVHMAVKDINNKLIDEMVIKKTK